MAYWEKEDKCEGKTVEDDVEEGLFDGQEFLECVVQ
jgi:hypothetical protein